MIHSRIFQNNKIIDKDDQGQSYDNQIKQEQGQIQLFSINKKLQKSVPRSETSIYDYTSIGTL